MKVASRNSWKILKPMSKMRTQLASPRTFTEEEFEKILKGLIPNSMEDKWFIFFEDNILYFHRSWTGECIYQILFSKQESAYFPQEVWVCRNPVKYKFFSKSYDEKILLFLIENLLLGNNIPFPMPKILENILPKGVYQHTVSGTGYKENIVEEE